MLFQLFACIASIVLGLQTVNFVFRQAPACSFLVCREIIIFFASISNYFPIFSKYKEYFPLCQKMLFRSGRGSFGTPAFRQAQCSISTSSMLDFDKLNAQFRQVRGSVATVQCSIFSKAQRFQHCSELPTFSQT